MRQIILSTILSALLAVSLPAQVCIDQQYVPAGYVTPFGFSSLTTIDQVFTVGLDGWLVSVELIGLSHHGGIATQDVRVDLVSVSGTFPTPHILASATIPAGTIGIVPTTVTADLRPFDVVVFAGEQYSIHVETTAPGTGPAYEWLSGGPAMYGYPGGACYVQRTVGPFPWDMGFRTYVDKQPGLWFDLSQPEGPSSLGLRNVGGIPGAVYITAVSFDPLNGSPSMGGGWWAGLFISFPELALQIGLAMPPFVGTLDTRGGSDFVFPAGTIPAFYSGLGVYGITRTLNSTFSGISEDSNIAQITLY